MILVVLTVAALAAWHWIGPRALLVIGLGASIAVLHWAGLFTDAAALISGVLWSLRHHPIRRCWLCGGKKTHSAAIWPGAMRPCRACEGSGQQAATLIRLTDRDRARRIHNGGDGR
jgi:hypothetical protein